MKTLWLLVILIVEGILVRSQTIITAEQQLDIVGPFSTTYFKWIKGDIAIILTYYNRTTEVWRTADSGQTWTSLKAKLPGSEVQSSQPGDLYENPADNSKFYIRGESTVSWISSNMGETWEAINPKTSNGVFQRFVNIEWHPKTSDWGLASVGTSGLRDVYYTTNFGRTWTFVTKAFQYTWGDAGQGDVPNTSIYLRVVNPQSTEGWNDFVVTTDFGATYNLVQSKTRVFLFLDKQLFTLLALPSTQEYILKNSPHIGSPYKGFYEATFPFGNELDYNGYSILDDSTGAVYMGVNHDNFDFPWGNIYVSNSIGDRYALSYAHVSQLWPFYDFVRIQGLDGVYITNVVQNWNENLPRSGSILQTFITLNNGGSWQALAPPHFDSNGNRIQCTGRCNLHLHGITSFAGLDSFGPVYTTPTAIGFILATGNVGESLIMEADSVNTYMSRDGGVNWIELRKGNSIYEFGDHGSIVVIAPVGEATTKIYYTLDEGATPLKSVDITKALDVLNIRVEPTATGEKFMVIGQRDGRGVVIGLDFSTVFDHVCTLSEYENWAPSDGKTPVDGLNCLLGKDVVYRRRNQTALCFNAEDIDAIVQTKACKCTEDDWECDVGFERDSNQNCVFPSGTPVYPPTVCPAGQTYNKTGYRQIAGTACTIEGGVNHWGDGPYDCPSPDNGGNGSKYGWVVAIVIVGVVIICVIAMFIAIQSEWVRDKVPLVKRLHGWKVGYFGMGNQPDTIGEEIEPDGGAEEFTIGGDEDEEAPKQSIDKSDDGFNPRG